MSLLHNAAATELLGQGADGGARVHGPNGRDDRESTLERASLATEIARLLPAFDQVGYPQWAALFDRFWQQAPRGTVLALDEFPALVAVAPEVPSLLQRHVDHDARRGIHLLLAGSSQRMMQGLVLDRSAPLYGRATEILRIGPLLVGWIAKALRLTDPAHAIEAYAVGGASRDTGSSLPATGISTPPSGRSF